MAMSAMICPLIINVKMPKINLNNNNVLKIYEKSKNINTQIKNNNL